MQTESTSHADIWLDDIAVEELETRLELAQCCTQWGCVEQSWTGACTKQVCTVWYEC